MKQVELYNHNKTTYENITRIFETSNKCATVQPTGSGKSFLIFKLAQDNSDKTIIVFEPNRQIIGRVSEQMKEYGIDNIKFYTYQKLNSQHKRDEISIANVDYICLDELHRIKAKQWEQAVIAIQEKFPNAKVLGLTATPERMDGQNIIDYFGAELACNITLGDAIVNKILPCPTYISALYTFDEEIQKVSEKIDESRNSDEEKNEMRAELNEARKQLENALGVPVILKKHIPDNDGKYLVFCQNVEHLNTMKSVIGEWFAQAGFDVNMYEVHTKNPNHKTEYNQFQTDNSEHIKLCLCIDMFNEGVHLEGISGVILLRPTQSNIIYFQQIGRAISASDKNVPIIFDLVNNSNSVGCGSLRTEIESAVDRQITEISNVDGECENDVFDIGDFHIYDYVKDSLDILNGIEYRCVDKWSYHFQQFLDFKKKNNHCDVSKSNSTEFSGLCEWVNEQRSCYHKKILNNKRKELLNENEFIWDIKMYRWIKIYNIAFEFVCELGNKIEQGEYYKGINLYKWVWNNKTAYNNGKLSVEQINLLRNIFDLDFNQNNENDKIWNEKYEILKEYMLLYNKITNDAEYKGVKIGDWYGTQFTLYNKGDLRSDRIKKMKSLNLLNSKRDAEWNLMYNMVVEFKKNKNVEIKQNTMYKGKNIGCWLWGQKKLYKSEKLSQHKIDLLNKIYDLNMDFDEEKNVIWDKKFLLLKEYLSLYSEITYNAIYKGINIGEWWGVQRVLFNNGRLKKDRVDKLKSLDCDIFQSKRDKNWSIFLNAIKECLANNVKITSKTIYKGMKVGINLCAYKSRYKKGKFPKEHYYQLLGLGIDLAKEGSLM